MAARFDTSLAESQRRGMNDSSGRMLDFGRELGKCEMCEVPEIKTLAPTDHP